MMEEVFEVVKRFPQGQCQNRTVEQIAVMTFPQQFINTAPDVCVSGYRRFRWAESVNRCTHDECFHDDDEVSADKNRLTETRRVDTSTCGRSRGSELFARKQGGMFERKAERPAAQGET